MTDLPTPRPGMPEIVFIGRSNVGKSSLVNMICNRKTLASTSATPGICYDPSNCYFHSYSNQSMKFQFIIKSIVHNVRFFSGHTKQFHFFAVNENRTDVSPFYLVDVPGLGYAEV